jgi:PAS domain S-box-containing protein
LVDRGGEINLQKYADKIINNVEESIVVVDSTYNILSVNEQTEALLNLDKKEIIGKQFNKIFNIIDSECILKSLLQNYNSPIKNQRCTLEINGDYKRVESHVEIIKNDKFIYGAIVFLRDITELEKTQKVLEESEEKFRSLYNSMISAYTLREIIYDDLGEPIDFRYLEVNPAFEKLTGIKRSNIIGKTYKDVYPNGKP